MKKVTIGAFLSAFACPGIGHFALELNRRGWFFLILTVICLALLTSTLMQVVTSVATDITEGTVPFDILEIRSAINERLAAQSTLQTQLTLGALVVVWVIALVDVIREGRKQDRLSNQ